MDSKPEETKAVEINKEPDMRRKFSEFQNSNELAPDLKESDFERKVVKLKRKIQPTAQEIDHEESTAIEDPKPGRFQLSGKLPTLNSLPSKEIKFNFNPNMKVDFNLKSSDAIQANLEKEKRREISMSLFDKVEKTNNPFIIKAPVKEESKESVVEKNPLSSEVALKTIQESVEDSPAKEFNIFEVKGNSKARASAESFRPVKVELPSSNSSVSIFKSSAAKNLFNFNFPKPKDEEQKSVEVQQPVKFNFGKKPAETPVEQKCDSPASDDKEQEKEPETVVEQAPGKLFQKFISELTTLKLEEKTLSDGMVCLEKNQENGLIYLLHRSFSGSIHFTGLVFPKSSKVKVVDKFKVKVKVSVYRESKYQLEDLEITFLKENDAEMFKTSFEEIINKE